MTRSDPSIGLAAEHARLDAGTRALTQRPHRDFTLRRLLALGDALAITAALGVATLVLGAETNAIGKFAWGLVTLPGWIVVFKAYGLYDRDAKRVSHSTIDDLPWIFHALVVGTLGLWLFDRFVSVEPLVVREALAFFATALVSLFVLRAGSRALARAATPPERVLFIGGGPMARLLVEKMRQHPHYGLNPVGYVDVVEGTVDGLNRMLPYLGTIGDLESVCIKAGIDRVVILAPAVDPDELADVVRRTRGLDIRISILPHIVDVLGPSVEIDDVQGITVLGVNPPALTPSSRFLKRATDILIASLALAVLLPVMLVIALAIKLTSAGPVFYSQERIGRLGQRFRIYKFRTMVRDAEERRRDLVRLSAHPAWLLLDNDPRVTRVGRFLRRTSLDELPQLWNVLKGDMSLVGPRPMPPDVDEHISGWGRRRLDLTPGITGLWQVLGRTDIPFEEMVKLDYLYVTNWSLWQDIRLLLHTLPAITSRRGAN